MHKTFYQYLMTKRNPGSTDPEAEFANNAFYDQSFPKQEEEFDALSKYLEENASYLPTMETFDSVWKEYQESF